MTNTDKAKAYVRAIRNVNKRRYADLYLEYLLGRRSEPGRIDLSLVAAQAVERNLRELLNEEATR